MGFVEVVRVKGVSIAAALTFAVMLGGCGDPRLTVGVGQGESETGDEADYATEVVSLLENRDVDILFVIDDSSGMGKPQATLAVAGMTQALEKREPRARYRIGFTSTDSGNPWCGDTLLPSRLHLSSCRSRLDDFVFTGTDPATDVRDTACSDVCPYEAAELDDLMRPSVTAEDPGPRVRPWIEDFDGATNLPSGVSPAEAFACFAPQGISGCGFESPLESLWQTLERMETPGAAEYGFIRRHAMLLIVVVTDEADCSYRDPSIFDANGTKVFWSDPAKPYPTSAVCWNAGVDCQGGPGVYERCDPVDKSASGLVTLEPADAVLHPLSRYVDVLQAVEDKKRELDPNAQVMVSAIAGVPSGYHNGMGDLVYADSPDPEFQAEFGIGPGCSSGDGFVAIPPIRLRDFVHEFNDRALYSICSNEYERALASVTQTLPIQDPPPCFEACVADTEPEAEGVQPNCSVVREIPGDDAQPVPACETNAEGHVPPDAGTDVCYGMRTDRTQSGPAFDDIDDACVDDGWNLEFEFVHAAGAHSPGGTRFVATCERSATPDLDCP